MAKLRVDKIASVGVSTETTGSVFFDDNGDYLAIPIGTDFDLGTADFTIELWWYKADSGNQYAWTLGDSKLSTGLELYVGTSGTETKIYTNNGPQLTAATNPAANEWHHYAVVRESGTLKLYIDGVQDPSTYDASSNDFGSAGGFLYIAVEYYNGGFNYDGLKYISNFRVCKGHAVYKSNFIVPTRELDVHQGPDDDRTVFLGLYDGENIFADKTGRHNHEIAAYGDRTSSPTPTATDSPIGITTLSPGLTRDVDNTFGPTFQGGAGFTSQNWLTLPKGTTTDRNRTGGRGISLGGAPSPSTARSEVIDYITISSMGNSQDFGNLTEARSLNGGCASSTRGICAGGYNEPVSTPGYLNTIDYITIAATGNAVNFGDLSVARNGLSGTSSSTRGVFAGGSKPPSDTKENVIDYLTIASLGDAINFGDLSQLKRNTGCTGSATRAIWAGGQVGPTITNVIDYVTIASTGDAADFGDLTANKRHCIGSSSSTRGIIAGGTTNPTLIDTIEYVTIATLGDATDFGNLTDARSEFGGPSNKIRAVFMGGWDSPVYDNRIDYITIATTGNASDFGTLGGGVRGAMAGISDSHGGI